MPDLGKLVRREGVDLKVKRRGRHWRKQLSAWARYAKRG